MGGAPAVRSAAPKRGRARRDQGEDAQRLRVFTREEAVLVRDQTGLAGKISARAWEYYAAAADKLPLGSR